jgi:hypothetical protein
MLLVCTNKTCLEQGKPQDSSKFSKESKSKTGFYKWCKICVSKHMKEYHNNIKNQTTKVLPEKAICSCKTCHAQGKPQDISNFSKDNSRKHGHVSHCKTCVDKHHEKVKDHRNEINKKYYQENKEKISKHHSEYRESNREKLLEISKVYQKKLALYNTYINQISLYEETRQDPDNIELIQVKCNKCENWFNPTNIQVFARIKAIEGFHSAGTENRLYCSDNCKQTCSVFAQKKYSSNGKKSNNKRRPLQSQLRELVLERDNNTCQLCGSTEDLICHHFTGVEQNPIESADVDNCITVCKKCDKRIHSQNGCKPIQLSCK